jgi:hypothetical protein
MVNRSRHSEQFRRGAAALVVARREQGLPRFVASVAEELKVSCTTLRGWVAMYTPHHEEPASPVSTPWPGWVLVGYAVHSRCRTALAALSAPIRGYRCATCPRLVWRAGVLHDTVMAAVVRQVPRLCRAGVAPVDLPRLLTRVRIDDGGRVLGLTWRQADCAPARRDGALAAVSSRTRA